MLKKIILLWLLFVSNIYAQKLKNGQVIYEVILNSSLEKRADKSKFKSLIKNARSLEITLTFSENESLFKKESSLKNDANSSINLTDIFADGKNSFYYNHKTKEFLKKTNIQGTNYLISKDIIKWKITSENKTIGKYNCYKAVIKLDDGKLGNVFAWFTPDLPVFFGPGLYNNLPGLIIVLQNDFVTYTARKISIGDNSISILKPNQGIKLTDEEFREKFGGIFSKN